MGRRAWRVLLVVALAATVLVGGGAATPAGGQAEGSRSISGTIRGIDGRFVNAQISMTLRTADDSPIGMDGQPVPRTAYARVVSMNPTAPLEGLEAGGQDQWRIDGLPANAHHFTLEVYPRGPGSGQGNWAHYGGAVKRRVTLPAAGLSGIDIVFPLNCDNVPGGTTGSIRVRRYHNGQPAGNLRDFLATGAAYPPWAMAGFRYQRDIPSGASSPTFDGIAPNHRYGVQLFLPGYQADFLEVPVRECQTTDVIVHTGSGHPVPPRFTKLRLGVPSRNLPVAGDFDGDGDDDLYFYGTGSPHELWTSQGNGTSFQRRTLTGPAGKRVTAGDFDGDGVDDLFFYGPGGAADRLWDFAADGSHRSLPANAPMGGRNTQLLAGDFDGNGRDDLLFATPGASSTLRRFTRTGHTDSRFSIPSGVTVRAGDLTGDWRADLLLYRRLRHYGEASLWINRGGGTAFTRTTHRVRPGALQPIVADLSGDFRADVLWYEPGRGKDVVWRGFSHTAPYVARESTDMGITGSFWPSAGDFTGGGTEDLLLFGPGGAADRVWRSNHPAWLPQRLTPR